MILTLRNSARPFRNAIACRQSYIEISNYLRGVVIPCRPYIKCEYSRRHQFHSSTRLTQSDVHRKLLSAFEKTISFPAATSTFENLPKEIGTGKAVTLHGYLGKRNNLGKKLSFVRFTDPTMTHTIQITAFSDAEGFENLKSIPQHSAVAVRGTVKEKDGRQGNTQDNCLSSIEIMLHDIQCLNEFPKDITMKPDTVFPFSQRYLQIRNDSSIRESIAFRAKANMVLRKELEKCQPPFTEVETPLLFKSTPEGAREFLVPTRNAGMAYALPQSPQQYKQILMASGIPRYYQFARCFRDEDLRADRQPEFTQLDLEMSFATAEDVMTTTEGLIRKLWDSLMPESLGPKPFPRMSYQDAMATYGSDKPDVRMGMEISRVEHMLPADLIGKISPLSLPIVEAFKLEGDGQPSETRKLLKTFMDSPTAQEFIDNPDGGPGTFVVDSRQPLSGLQALGFEAAEALDSDLNLQSGDLLILQARKNEPFSGGSTPVGDLRRTLHKVSLEMEFKESPEGFNFLWVTGFPLFSPVTDSEPGQGGSAGIASTHHPFTAPRTPEDVSLLLTDPTKTVADHYDLVVNGVELGGGSRRIHSADVQEFVLRDILKLPPSRLADFSHLLEALRAGCPPHAGIALGFDRLIAMMVGSQSVRDVIAFPKAGKGEDPMANSPSPMTEESLETYHLRVRDGK